MHRSASQRRRSPQQVMEPRLAPGPRLASGPRLAPGLLPEPRWGAAGRPGPSGYSRGPGAAGARPRAGSSPDRRARRQACAPAARRTAGQHGCRLAAPPVPAHRGALPRAGRPDRIPRNSPGPSSRGNGSETAPRSAGRVSWAEADEIWGPSCKSATSGNPDGDPATGARPSQPAASQIGTQPSSNRDPDRSSAACGRDAAPVLRHIPRRPCELHCPAMKVPEPLEHESLPDSAYAQELRRGFPELRFAPDLERVFQEFHLTRSRARVRFFQLALGLLALAAAVDLTVLDSVPLLDVALGWLGVVIPACLALALTSWSRLYERLYLPAARLLLPVIAMVSAFGVADRRVGGHPDLFYFLTSFSIAIFFLGGQLFREALLVDIFMVGALCLALAHAGWPAAEAIYYATVLVITSA